ncbi:MAG: hypothetical protein K940chlam2_01468 [Chlamydiae bacterium]|nr:hypothetical protein [Chlamydiota bacterium]
MIALRICKSLIEQCPPEKAAALMQLMPDKWQLELKGSPAPTFIEGPLLEDDLASIHTSWLAPHLRTFPEGDIRLFLAALEPEKATALRKTLGLANTLPHLTKLSRSYLRNELFRALSEGVELLPATLLPNHPANALMHRSSAELPAILLDWGLHDLAYEMRKIISTAELKKIFNGLNKPEGEYLKSLLLQSEPLVFKRHFLQGWDGEKEMLHVRLEERGAERLGALLFGCDESLAWHLTHRLEMGLAGKVLKYRKKCERPRAVELLTAQLKGLLARRAVGGSA